VPQRAVLSEITLRAAKPPARGPMTIWDGSLKHFGLRVSQGGTKSFIVLLGSGRRQAIGRYPTITLAQARTKAKEILAERTLGKHRPKSITWEAAVEQFLEASKHKNRARTYTEYKRILKRYFPFGTTRLSEITKDQIARKLDKLHDTPSQQNHALVCAKVLFRWAVTRGYLDSNPTAGFIPTKTLSRSRVLSHTELKSIWLACSLEPATREDADTVPEGAGLSNLPRAFTTIIKLLILTGQRRGEIAALHIDMVQSFPAKHSKGRPQEEDGSTPIASQCAITLPRELTKNGREHTFPIGVLAAKLLALHINETASLLFPGRRNIDASEKPFNGWSKAKAALDKRLGDKVAPWTLHDLRRTYATNMAQLGVAPHVVEKLLNHATGTISGVSAIYNRYQFMDEMRAAVEKWEARLQSITETLNHCYEVS
jgi:integrase